MFRHSTKIFIGASIAAISFVGYKNSRTQIIKQVKNELYIIGCRDGYMYAQDELRIQAKYNKSTMDLHSEILDMTIQLSPFIEVKLLDDHYIVCKRYGILLKDDVHSSQLDDNNDDVDVNKKNE